MQLRTKQPIPKPGGGQQICRPWMHGEQRKKSGTQMPCPPSGAVHRKPGQQKRSIPPHDCPKMSAQLLRYYKARFPRAGIGCDVVAVGRGVEGRFCCETWCGHFGHLLAFTDLVRVSS
jgi:hypothetical protein